MRKIWLVVIGTAFLAIGAPAAEAQGRANCATANADIGYIQGAATDILELDEFLIRCADRMIHDLGDSQTIDQSMGIWRRLFEASVLPMSL